MRDTIQIVILPIIFFLLYSIASIVRHENFNSYAFDLGIYTQVAWLYSQLDAPLSTIRGIHIFGDHFAPSFALLAPFMRLFPDAKTLLILQALIVTSGAIPLGLIARRLVRSRVFVFALQLNYLLFFGLQRALLFDVHMITFATGFLCWMLYFFVRKRWVLYWVFLLIALWWKEDVSTIIASFGVVAFVFFRNVRVGLLTIAIGVGWFFLVTRLLIPFFNEDALFMHQASLPTTINAWQNLFFDHPDKRASLFWSFGSFFFLPILSPLTLIPVFTHFLIHFIDPAFQGRWGIGLHYRVPLAPFLSFSTIYAVVIARRFIHHTWRHRVIVGVSAVMVVSALFAQWRLHLPLNSLTKPAFFRQEAWMRDLRAVMQELPDDVSVGTFNNIAPHIAARRDIRVIIPNGDQCGTIPCPWPVSQGMEYLLVDMRPGQPPINFWRGTTGRVSWNPAPETNSGLYCTIAREGDAMLLRVVDQEKTCP